jgi:hypothetical protein
MAYFDSDSDSSMDSVEDRFSRLQWVFHVECNHYLSQIHIKEFCAYCIQTGESFTLHIKAPQDALFNATLEEMAVYKHQTAKHKLLWLDGDLTIFEFLAQLTECVQPKISDIFVASKLIKNYFQWSSTKTWGYKHIIYVDSIPKFCLLHARPDTYCKTTGPMKSVQHSKTHCARRKAHEIAHYLKPAYVPYLNFDLIKTLSMVLPQGKQDTEEVEYVKKAEAEYNTQAENK